MNFLDLHGLSPRDDTMARVRATNPVALAIPCHRAPGKSSPAG